ncbi:hypothetical protein V6N12_070267 [Hibiscus sabdariffa]|uniref:Subtilisin-like protease fibronectin type-III domain-containing protein n=1 Tax=Hibiscus sabdariffa TaxID=183260 RepID=A0ABR2FGA7_9ROSI
MDACDDIDELKKVAGNIVVCQDPGSLASFSGQFNNILAAGNAAGVFITNYTHLDISIQSSFPALFLGQKNGDVVLGYIKTNKTPKASIEFKRTFLGFKPSPTVTSYTSRGPSFSSPSVLKPDIMAPDLNYPSFIVYFNGSNVKSDSNTMREFQRTVTNVGEGSFIYNATLTPMKGLKVTVEPHTLVFKEKNEKQSFKLRIEVPPQLNETVSFGYLAWEDSQGKHVVRSPIVATSYSIVK